MKNTVVAFVLPGITASTLSPSRRRVDEMSFTSFCRFTHPSRETMTTLSSSTMKSSAEYSGSALSLAIEVRRLSPIKDGEKVVGNRTRVKVVKNKLAPPFREAEFDMIYGEGISKSGAILDAGVEQSIIEKSGTWYSFKNERIGQGRENAKKWLQENPTVLVDLEMKIRETLGLRAAVPVK